VGELPHDDRVDSAEIVERIRAVVAEGRERYPRTWTPQASVERLPGHQNREPAFLLESIDHLHANWDMSDALNFKGRGWGPKAIVHRLMYRIVNVALSDYLGQEHAYRAATAQSIDYLARRLDDVSFRDERDLLEAIRDDLLDLARHVEDRINEHEERA
jgi:hypothetical protein